MTDQTPPAGTPAAAAPKAIGRWLFEGLFIVMSVLRGFAVSEFGESRRERKLARQILASVQAEIEYNRGALAPFLRRAAWDTAASTFSAVFAQSAFYDSEARGATIRLSQTMMTELVWTEGNLFKLYEQHLPAIRAAAGAR